MQINPTTQRIRPDGAPVVVDPVNVKLDVPVYYTGDGTPQLMQSPIYCSGAFAEIILQVLNDWAAAYSFRVCHLGVYNPRMARRVDGTPIRPTRWSNHAWGAAIDFAGVLTTDNPDNYMCITDMLEDDNYRDIAQQLLDRCQAAIDIAGRRSEIVNEGHGNWMHLGIRP